jgi:hypothetical protein
MFWGRRRSLGIAAVAIFAAAFPSLASAAGSTSSTATVTTPTVPSPPTVPVTTPAPPPPKPGAARGSVTIYLPDAFFVHRQPVTAPRRVLHVVGIVRPYVPDQRVTVRAFLGRRLIKSEHLRLIPSRNHAYGHFRLGLSSPGVGNVVVSVTHAATDAQASFTGRRGFAVLDARAGFGSTGRFVQLIQQRLAALHLYIPQTGVYDQGTGLALDAYHRLLHWGTYQTLDGRTISFLLDGFGAFKVRYPGHGRHAEGNLSLQLVALADGSRVEAIYPISSGKPSTPTILGDFHVYSKVPGYLPDGMYDSNFFFRGYAIHGYNPAPDYPASHGCMRLPIVDAPSVFGWLSVGDWVDVYY